MLYQLPEEGVRILVVDDDMGITITLEEILKPLGEIIVASTGKEAVEQAGKYRPDLIMMDIELPDFDGLTATKLIRERALGELPAVIFITSHAEKDYEYTSLAEGANDFIAKPVNLAVCFQRVKNQLLIRQQAKAIEREQRDLKQLVRQVPVFISYWSLDWNNQYCNDIDGRWFGISSAQMESQPMGAVFHQSLATAILAVHANLGEEPVTFAFDSVLTEQVKPYPEHFQVYISARFHRSEKVGYLVTLVDVSTLKITKDELRQEKERLRVTLNSIGDAVIATDTKGVVNFLNPIAERMTGFSQREAIGRRIEQVMDLVDSDSKEILKNPIYIALEEQRIAGMAMNSTLCTKGGKSFHVEDCASPIRDGEDVIIGAIIVFHDISETVAMSIKMSYLANHDQLTGLPNRIVFQDRLNQALQIAKAYNHRAAMLLIDLDNFKLFNESLGHRAGDKLLHQISEKLKALVEPNHTLARLGGDEFVVLVPEFVKARVVQSLASSIVSCAHTPFEYDGKTLNVSVSIGISIYPDDCDEQESMIRHADMALYRSKQEGRNRYSFFSSALEQRLHERRNVERTLRQALIDHALEVHYQPKFDLRSNQILGAEALVRLRDGEGSLISPVEFIPLAEETGLITLLGEQVMRAACQQAARWNQNGFSISIAVNVAARQFGLDDFLQTVKQILAENGIPNHALEIEVTETALMQDMEKTQVLISELKALGIRIAIDDFGTGYSSLSYLKKFKADTLKIDMSFIRDMLEDQSDLDIVSTIIALGKSMKLTIVAEGVELEAQREKLSELGCDLGQGYLYSPAVPADQFMDLLLKLNQ